MRLFDSHCHLDFAEFDADRAEVLKRARAAGVHDLLVPGYEPEQWPRVVALVPQAAEHDVHLHVAVGIHPYALTEGASGWVGRPEGELASVLMNAARQHGAAAIGECGLDAPLGQREGERCRLAQQGAVLREHLHAASACELPLVLHVVRAHALALELLREAALRSPPSPHPRGVIHAFSGSAERVREYVGLGFMLAFGGSLTHSNHARAHAAARATPDTALLIETDAPSGRLAGGPPRNEPSQLAEVLRALAALRDTTPEHVASVTSRNACALFRVNSGA